MQFSAAMKEKLVESLQGRDTTHNTSKVSQNITNLRFAPLLRAKW
jgi:hypothetical protein